ncbi:kinase-like domain-containing protein [Rhizophagus irregularis DAOM 181602=DAOM 197198]|nr:kinase-like domain-containing protein [Rhizophagus irregularis DAOM 181602=DAOM 197198]
MATIRQEIVSGCSEIYTAVWIDGPYYEWDSKEKQLKRDGRWVNVVLKKLENVESANKSWFEEGMSHLYLGSKTFLIVRCYGLTQNPFNGNYMIVMNRMDINLREYLQQNHNKLTWKERIQIIDSIISAVYDIHREGTPLEYKELMEQCWDANPAKRPDIYTLSNKMGDIYRSYCQNENEQRIISKITSINSSQLNTRFNVNSSSSDSSFFGNFSASSSNWNISSRVYNFENLPEPKNATKEEQDAYYSIQFDFDLQDGLIIEEKSNKRSYFDYDEKDLASNSNKKSQFK